jgi:hypothetical protein
MTQITVATGGAVPIAGIYVSLNCCTGVERYLEAGSPAPVCQQCQQAVTWKFLRPDQKP